MDLDSVDSSTFVFETFEGGWTVAFLFTIVASSTLEPRIHELYEVSYGLLESGVARLDFCDSLGQPSVTNSMIPELVNDPHRTSGTILFGEDPSDDDVGCAEESDDCGMSVSVK